MTASDMDAISPAEQRMLDILSRPEIGPQATLAALREAGLVPPADGCEVRTLEPVDVEMITLVDQPERVLTHDPSRSHPLPQETSPPSAGPSRSGYAI
jgi:hypothetical protein